MSKLMFASAVISSIENFTGMDFQWFVLLIFFFSVEIILRSIPTKNNPSLISNILIFIQKIIDFLIMNRSKDGKIFVSKQQKIDDPSKDYKPPLN